MKKIIALFLSLIMVFAMSAPVYAGTTPDNSTRPVYLALGDSIGAGYALDEDPGLWLNSLTDTGKKIDSCSFISTAYPNVFFKTLGADKSKSYDATYPGLRARDMCYILGTKSFENGGYDKLYDQFLNTGFDFGGFRQTDNNCISTLHSFKPELDNYIKNADVISIQFGNNDLTEFMVTSMLSEDSNESLLPIILKVINGLDKENGIESSLNAVKVAFQQYIINPDFINNAALVHSLYGLNKELKKAGSDLSEFLKIFMNNTKNSIGNATKYSNELVQYIRDINPDAKILVINLYNPLQMPAKDEVSDSEYNEYQQIYSMLSTAVEPLVNSINKQLKQNSSKYKYSLIDIKGAGILADPLRMFHPDAAGHKAIADLMFKEYSQSLPEPIEPYVCQHNETMLKGMVEASYLEKGYTGDKVCTYCDELIEKGKATAKLIPSATKVTSINSGAAKFAIKWNKKADITGYDIKYSTDKNFKNSKTVSVKPADTAVTTIDGLKTSTKYYVKVRTYKNVKDNNGKTVKCPSEWSAVKTVTTRPYATKITSLSQSSKKFTVKWNKKTNITGYEVKYSTNKSFKNSKTVAVKSSKTTKKTIKKLNKKTKYYVKVRTYKNVKNTDGKYVKCPSEWSAVKTVTTK